MLQKYPNYICQYSCLMKLVDTELALKQQAYLGHFPEKTIFIIKSVNKHSKII